MRKIISILLYCILYPVILVRLRRTGILSIYGHNITRNSFRPVVTWLIGRGFNFVSEDVVHDFITGGKLPHKRCVWLSFDDGWKTNYTDVFPVLKEFCIPASIYVATQGIENGYFWFEKAFANRKSEYYNEIQELWEMPNQRRVEIIEKLPGMASPRSTMTSTEILEMTKSGLVQWGNHTNNHVICNQCSPEELSSEILECDQKIRKWTNCSCLSNFSYPNGDKDESSLKLIESLGFKMAATTNIGFITPDTELFQIPRNELKDNACLQEQLLHVFGLWSPIFNCIKRIIHKTNKK